MAQAEAEVRAGLEQIRSRLQSARRALRGNEAPLHSLRASLASLQPRSTRTHQPRVSPVAVAAAKGMEKELERERERISALEAEHAACGEAIRLYEQNGDYFSLIT